MLTFLLCVSAVCIVVAALSVQWALGCKADANRWEQQCELAEQRALHWFEEHGHARAAMGELMQRRAEEKRKARESAMRGWETRRKPLQEAA